MQFQNSNEMQFHSNSFSESYFELKSCKYVELTRNYINDPLTDAITLLGDSVVCCEMNQISGVKIEFSAIALREFSGANLQKNLI